MLRCGDGRSGIARGAAGPGGNAIPQSNITYILPQWPAFTTTPDAAFASELAELRTRIPEGPRVKVGFTTYINISMNDPDVDPRTRGNSNCARGHVPADGHGDQPRPPVPVYPICLSFLTAIREAPMLLKSPDKRPTDATCSGIHARTSLRRTGRRTRDTRASSAGCRKRTCGKSAAGWQADGPVSRHRGRGERRR